MTFAPTFLPAANHDEHDAAVDAAPVDVEPAQLVVSDTCASVRFEASDREALFDQMRAFLTKHDPEKGRVLSEKRRTSADTLATILGSVIGQFGSYADWERDMRDPGQDNAPDRRNLAKMGQAGGPRVTGGDLLLLRPSVRKVLWLVLLGRDTGVEESDPQELATAAHKDSFEAMHVAFQALVDGEVNLSEAEAMAPRFRSGAATFLKMAQWAERHAAKLKGAA